MPPISNESSWIDYISFVSRYDNLRFRQFRWHGYDPFKVPSYLFWVTRSHSPLSYKFLVEGMKTCKFPHHRSSSPKQQMSVINFHSSRFSTCPARVSLSRLFSPEITHLSYNIQPHISLLSPCYNPSFHRDQMFLYRL